MVLPAPGYDHYRVTDAAKADALVARFTKAYAQEENPMPWIAKLAVGS
jgi:hypothetical protein